MAKLIAAAEPPWYVDIKCKGGCKYIYRYFWNDVWVGTFSEGKREFFVRCPNCRKYHFVDPPRDVQLKATPTH